MKCPKCNGSGWDDENMIKCLHCYGSGEVEITNEEWLNTLNTEQLATFLAIVQYDGTDLTLKKNHVEKWVEWLKQPHKE